MWLEDVGVKTPFQFVRTVSRPYIRPAIVASVAVILGSAAETVAPYAFKKVIDLIVAGGVSEVETILLWAGAFIALSALLAPALYRLSGFAGMRWAVGVRATATEALSSYVTKHSHAYFSNRFAGAIGGKIGNASEAARKMVGEILWTHLTFVTSLAASLALVFTSHVLLGTLFLFWILITTIVNVAFARKRVPRSFAAQAEDTKMRARLIDLLTNIFAMHDFARRTFELEGIREQIMKRYGAGIRNWTFAEFTRIANNLSELIFMGTIIFSAIYLWSTGATTAGDLILILTLMGALSQHLSHIGRAFNEFSEYYGEVKEGLQEVLAPHEILDAPFAVPLRITAGDVQCIDVSFGYGRGDSIFSSLDLSIPTGQKVGIVGRSGAGKSTLMKLLLRQYDVMGGKILIDGQDISLATQESVRDSISIIPQEPMLFHRSLKENIRYGNLGATESEMIKAAKLAQAHSFIDKLPEGYETLVGERGVKLSGGQRQRVAIARAILKDSRILILDEATSSLDSESESLIQHALRELMRGKTVIAVAHRLSTLRIMDRIVVLDEGKIIEDGTHEELLRLGGTYAELWAHQAGGFLQDESPKERQTKQEKFLPRTDEPEAIAERRDAEVKEGA